MKRNVIRLAAVPALAAGLAFAQQAPHGREHMQKLATELNLTEAQKQQAHDIFSQAHQAAQPLVQQLRENHQALANAVKSGASDAEIDRLANQTGPLVSQLAAIHAKAFAKFSAALTPEQREKLGSHMGQFLGRGFGPGMGMGPRGHGPDR